MRQENRVGLKVEAVYRRIAELNLSVREVAISCGNDTAYLHYYLKTGKGPAPNYRKRLQRVLRCKWSDIFYHVEDEKSPPALAAQGGGSEA